MAIRYVEVPPDELGTVPAEVAERLWGLHEVAAYYGISRQLALKWAARSDFPEPLAELAQGRVWDADQVRAWGRRHGRRKGSGPGEPKGGPR